MSNPVKVVLAGINGYGRNYLELMLTQAQEHNAVLSAVVDPAAEHSDLIGALREKKIPVFSDINEFYARESADLVVFSTPIQLHCSNTITALERGSNVLCEKPLCATIDEGLQMLAATKKFPALFAAIGYNWSFSPTIQRIKKDILDGRYGAPKAMKCLVCWPRNHGYYSRNNWAGMLKTPRGEWVLDSPLNNATAHYLHNIFYVCGKTAQTSAEVVEVQAELYRANPITSFDTASVRCRLADGTPVHFYTTHAEENACGPLCRYEFEKGTLSAEWNTFVGRLKNGELRTYPAEPDVGGCTNKLWQCIAHCRDGGKPACGVEAALELTKAVNGAHLSMPEVTEFPENLVVRQPLGETNHQMHVPSLLATMVQCYDQELLFSELGGLPWARPGKRIQLKALEHFSL